MTVSEYREALDQLISDLVNVRDDIQATVRLNSQLTPAVRLSIRNDVLAKVQAAVTSITNLVLD